MARIGVGNKYNLAINGVGYLVRGLNYKKKDARVFSPRFGTGEMGETDLDTWKVWQQEDLSGGMFQELFEDITKVDALNKIQVNPRDKLLHPTPPSLEAGIAAGTIDGTAAWATSAYVLYKSANYYSAGVKGAMYKMEANVETDTVHGAHSATAVTITCHSTTGFNAIGVMTIGTEKIKYTGVTATTFTGCTRGYNGTTAASIADDATITQSETYKWTAVKTDFANGITDITLCNGCLWVATGNGNPFWKWNGTTWTSSTLWTPQKVCAFNAKILGTSAGTLFSHDASTADGVRATIGVVGDANIDCNSMIVFNHRLYIGKPDGLFAYDGVQITCVLSYANDVNANNFRYMAVHNGALYFICKNQLYRFNGSTVEEIKDLTNLQTITAMASGYGRLWFLTTAPSGYFVTGGKGGEVPANAYCLYYYDGVGVTLYDDLNVGIHTPYCIAFTGSILSYFVSGASAVLDTRHFYIDLSKEFTAKSMNVGTIFTSSFDAGFGNIDKAFESFEVNHENMIAGDTIGVYYKLYDGDTWDAAWSNLGQITSATSNRLWRYTTPALNGVFKKSKFKIVVTRVGTSTLGIRSYAMKYIISPDYKREWQISLLAVGSTNNPLELLDGTAETVTSYALRENIYACRENDSTIPFEDIDFTITNGAVTTTATSITVDTTHLFPSAGFIKIDDEIIKYTGKSATQFTGCTRASLSTSAATHTDNEIVNSYYRVILSDIINEEVYWPVDPPVEATPSLVNPETIQTIVLKEA